ncbi:DUF6934 family protein [Mucilaginibacter ginsenosidivorax]|uniref:Uncharacterized protein n=1 Tax=Mucilaginibacter ginsenosidivorax TaxID=862126 RepID=A0A5B8VYB1_9SPHI|nr:hypothetical protein [Mucilaginibacter ginsenosidivorax]QEC75942.1 hypothetical protein FSB76_08270 [Mucilaginibacter ginsenosidivorax]
MNLDRYNYQISNDHQDYIFYSEGPKGKIKKIVRFSKIQDLESTVYNLGFGDADDETGVVDDSVVTNNKDSSMVLATVANTVIDFTNYYGNQYIYATGSTPARTRLYQIGIAGLWEKISIDFEVYGLKEDSWHEFKKNVNYDAFLVRRK